MNLVERSNIQLMHQQQALLKEFEYWRNNSNPGTAYAKHYSQIRSITGAIEKFLNDLPHQMRITDELFEQHSVHAAGLLYASHIWAFFRSKFALRLVGNHAYSLKELLKCADEFAWNCYGPARDAAIQAETLHADDLKEPPLTFFANDAGPYMAQRNALFDPEGIKDQNQTFQRFQAALQQLPVPIIAMPWVQSNYLPAAVVIAHEVGHLIEGDFAHAKLLQDAIMGLTTIDENRRPYWRKWTKELFADTYAILCSGPAYLVALMEYLVAPQRIVVHETLAEKTADIYPTRALRMVFNLAVLRILELPDEGIGQMWQDAYPHPELADYDKFCNDAVQIAALFLKTPIEKLGNRPLTQIMMMTPEQWQTIKSLAQKLLDVAAQRTSLAIATNDEMLFRTWFAAATWANHTDPNTFTQMGAQHLLLGRLAATITGVRRGPTHEAPAATPAAVARAGEGLMAQFLADSMDLSA